MNFHICHLTIYVYRIILFVAFSKLSVCITIGQWKCYKRINGIVRHNLSWMWTFTLCLFLKFRRRRPCFTGKQSKWRSFTDLVDTFPPRVQQFFSHDACQGTWLFRWSRCISVSDDWVGCSFHISLDSKFKMSKKFVNS